MLCFNRSTEHHGCGERPVTRAATMELAKQIGCCLSRKHPLRHYCYSLAGIQEEAGSLQAFADHIPVYSGIPITFEQRALEC